MKICAKCHATNDDDEACCAECGHASFENSPQDIPRPFLPFILFGYSLGKNEVIPFHQRCVCCLGSWVVAVAGMAMVGGGLNRVLLMSPILTPAGVLVVLACSTLNFEPSFSAAAIAGWLYYLILTVASLRAKGRRIFVLLFVILCVSMLLNIAGCEGMQHAHMNC